MFQVSILSLPAVPRRAAPAPMTFPNHAGGAPGPSRLGTGENTNFNVNYNVMASASKTPGYDSENHPMSMTASGTAVSMVYDGDGNRVAKTADGITTEYLVDDLNPTGYPQVMEEVQGGAVVRQYTYGLHRIDENQPISNQWMPSFYGYDGGGNVRQLTKTSATVTDSYEYDAYGNSFTVSGSTPNEMMYRGEQYDSDLGLCYLRARYYNPATGRFVSRDPKEGTLWTPSSLRRYLYASNDPVDRIDPSGRTDLAEVNLNEATISFSNHGALHLLEEGYDLVKTQAQVEAYIEVLVRQFIADLQAAGGNLPNLFDVTFQMSELDNVPWAARLYIVDAADLRISTYFPLIIP
jgi:RHS repeat-associated protein